MFHDGQIISFINHLDGKQYDGIIWRILHEDETNISLVIRYVDEVNV